MTYRSMLLATTIFVAATPFAQAQDISAEDLCDAGIGEVFGGFGRLGCKAVQNKEITADDVVGALAGRSRVSPLSRSGEPPASIYPFTMPADAPVPSRPPQSQVHPCETAPLSLECEYQRILDELEAEYGPLTGPSNQ